MASLHWYLRRVYFPESDERRLVTLGGSHSGLDVAFSEEAPSQQTPISTFSESVDVGVIVITQPVIRPGTSSVFDDPEASMSDYEDDA